MTAMTTYQSFIHTSRYARWIEEENRREHWSETVDRYVDFMREHLESFGKDREDPIFDEVRAAILNLDVMPSMRSLMTSGPALKRENLAGFNCSFVAFDNVRAFDELLYILANGTGAGFSVERRYTDQLPIVADHFAPHNTVVTVEDSREGWAAAFRELIEHLYQGFVPQVDVSKVRPKGARLRTFGGRASGPGPLLQLFDFTEQTFKAAAGRRLTPLEVHDIATKVGEVIVSGGVRRSALISLSDLSDFEMAKAKSGTWWENNGQRALANNSAVYTKKPSAELFLREWRNLIESQSGERGIFNLEGIQANVPVRRDGGKVVGTNPCVTGDTVIATVDGPRTFADLAEVGEDVLVYSWHPATKTPVVRWMRRPHRTRVNAELLKVTFDSGLVVRCTPDHHFYTFRGRKVAAKNIRVGESIRAFSASRDISGHERVHGWDSQRNAANHQWTHRMLLEAHGVRIPDGFVVAHLDGDGSNNDLHNLAVMSDLGHRRYDMPKRQAAGMDGHSPNHKVVSVEPDGYADVFNGCVDDSHTYIILDQDPVAGHMSGVVSANCGEISLRNMGLCNLSEVVVRATDKRADLIRKAELAAIIGTWQSTLTKFKYVRSQWRKNAEEERLLGVSLTGIYGNKLLNDHKDKNLPFLLQDMQAAVITANEVEAKSLGINPSVSTTTVKPSGTVSQLTGVSSGIHPWHSEYYIRTVRGSNTDPLTQLMKDSGIPHEPDVMNPDNTTVFSFPVAAPPGAVTRDMVSALDHLEMYKVYRLNWAEHQVSITVTVKPEEWVPVANWVWENWDIVAGVSFLPHSEHTYAQPPYAEVSADEYKTLLAESPKSVRFADLAFYEHEDGTTGARELACSSDTGCEDVNFGQN